MFDNPGRMLKQVSKILFGIAMIAFFVLGAVTLTHMNFVLGVAIISGGWIVSVLLFLPIYALGELVCAAQETRDNTNDILVFLMQRDQK